MKILGVSISHVIIMVSVGSGADDEILGVSISHVIIMVSVGSGADDEDY